MPEIHPFKGLRYASNDSMPKAIAPPYDVIDDAARAELAASSFNAVHIELSQAGEAGDRYAQAKAILDSWRADGTVAVEAQPTYYVYAQTFDFAGSGELTRAGVFSAVHQSDTVLGHERTHQSAKDDRFKVLEATKTNISPIFSVIDDPDGAMDAVINEVMTGAPELDFQGPDGLRHRLWLATDAAQCAALSTAVREREAFIADGHHRYETSVTYRDSVGGPGSDAVTCIA